MSHPINSEVPMNKLDHLILSSGAIWIFIFYCSETSVEVLDKVPQTSDFWICTLLSSLLLLALFKVKKWWPLTLILGATPGLTNFWITFGEITSPEIHSSILAEAGSAYFIQYYGALGVLILLIVGLQALSYRTKDK